MKNIQKKPVILLLLPLLLGCKNKAKEPEQEKMKPLANPYEHVVIFGVDGAGGEFKNIDTPNFDRIFGSGSINYDGVAQSPTISAQNWGAMAYGVGPEKHGKTNSYIANNKHTDASLPSFFKTHSDKHPDATYASIVNWTPLNYGMFEDIPNLYKDNISDQYSLSSYEIDEKVAEHCIARVQEHSDAIVFLDFDSVDAAGHSAGSSSELYKEYIRHIDTLLGQIYDAYVEKNLLVTTLFMCVSDHGHTPTGGHGGESELEKAVVIAVNGGGNKVIQGNCGAYTTTDVAPIVLYALGEEIPSHYDGKVPENMFITE